MHHVFGDVTLRLVGRNAAFEDASYLVDPGGSAVLIQADSTVGTIELATTALEGAAAIVPSGSGVEFADPVAGWLQLPVSSLSSGNALYDAEIHRRLDADRFPVVRAELLGARRAADGRWMLSGELTIHGTARVLTTTAELEAVDDKRLRLLGEQVIDIREFAISLPRTLMLRIYPEVMVRFRIEAVRES